MGIAALDEERLARDLYAAASQGGGPAEVGAEISRVIASVVAHDAMSLVGADPMAETGRGCFSFWHQYEPGLVGALVRHHYLAGDPPAPAAPPGSRTAAEVVGGDGPPDRRTRELLTAYGASSELRLALRDRRGTWGGLALLRSEGGAPFDREDARRVGRLGAALITALRRYATAGPLCPSVPALPAGVIMVGPDHEIKAVSPQARAWLDQMSAHDRYAMPPWVPDTFCVALSLAARTHARRHRALTSLVCVPPVVGGRWMAFQGQSLDAEGAGDVALVVQAATGDLVLPSFCEWYGITSRERLVIEELRTGATAKQIARRLGLSVHTVNDHLKAVFRKTGADGRDELIAAMTR